MKSAWLTEEKNRPIFLIAGSVAAAIFLMLGLVVFPSDSRTAALLFDLSGKLGTYPFTVQGLMWLMFFLALADATYIYLGVEVDKAGLRGRLLPEEKSKMISGETARTIYRSITSGASGTSAVPFLVLKTLTKIKLVSYLRKLKKILKIMKLLIKKNI